MVDLKIVFVAVAATLVMCQMVSATPTTAPTTGEDGLTLERVQATVSIAMDDVKKNFQEMATKAEKVMQDIRTAAQSPESQNMLNSMNDQLAKLAANVKDAAKDLSARIQSSASSAAPAS